MSQSVPCNSGDDHSTARARMPATLSDRRTEVIVPGLQSRRQRKGAVWTWMLTPDIAKTSFTGWYPNTSAFPYDANGYGCEGGAAYGSDVLLFRNYKNGTILETHLYQAGNALDAAAINAATDLGNMTPSGATYASLTAYGMTVSGSTAYVRYGFSNNPGAYSRILMVSIPEPATLALVVLGGCGLLLRRRHV